MICKKCNNIMPLAPGGGPVEWEAICWHCGHGKQVEIIYVEEEVPGE